MTFRPRPPTLEALLAELAQRVRNLEEAHLGHTTQTGQWLTEDRDGNLWRKDTGRGVSYPVPLGVIARVVAPGTVVVTGGSPGPATTLMRVQRVLFLTGHSYQFVASVRAISGGAGDTAARGVFQFAWTSNTYTTPTVAQWNGDGHYRTWSSSYGGGTFETWYDHAGPPLVVTLWILMYATATTSVTFYGDTTDAGLWVIDAGPTLPGDPTVTGSVQP